MSVRTLILCLATCLLCISKVAIGDALSNEQVEAELTNTYSITPSSGDDYQYRRHDYVDEVGVKPSQSMDTFYQRLLKGNHTALPGKPVTRWIPIAGDITFFIPKEETEYPLAKRVGDAFVQSQLIRSQVFNQVGRHLLSLTFQSEAQQIDVLYDNAFSLSMASGFTKKFGDALTPEDIALGGKDILWPELRTISGEQVLVPVIYLTDRTYTDQNVSGYKVEFNEGEALFREVVINSGSVTLNRKAILSAAENFVIAEGAEVVGTDSLNLKAGGTLFNTGSISAANAIDITAANYYQKTIVHRFNTPYGFNDRLGLVSSIVAGESIEITTVSDIGILGSSVESMTGAIKIDAGGDITVGGVLLETKSLIATNRDQIYSSKKEYVQANISARDNIKLMAEGNINIDASNLFSEKGQIDILAGLGVSIINGLNEDKTISHSSYGDFTEDESNYVTIAIRSVLDAGLGVVIHTDTGDITLQATDISSGDGTTVSASAGKIEMLMAIENDQYSYSSVKESLFTIENVSEGHDFQAPVHNTIVGGFKTEALYGVSVQFEGDPTATLQEQVINLSALPGMEWMQQVWDAADPVEFTAMELAYREWKEKNTSLTPAAMAVISMVAAMAVGPAALKVGEALVATSVGTSIGAGIGAATLETAVAAGVTSFTAQAAVAAGNGMVNGNISDAMDEFITSETTWTNIATAMVTAGAIDAIDAKFFEPSEIDIEGLTDSLKSKGKSVDEIKQAVTSAKKFMFKQQSIQALTNSVVDAGVKTLATEGAGFSSFEDTFKTSFYHNAVNLLGETAAAEIGALAHAPESEQISNLPKYLLHAGLGCTTGYASAAIDKGETTVGCYSGAVGSIIGEASELSNSSDAQEFESWLTDYYGSGSYDDGIVMDKINYFTMKGVNFSRVLAGLTAFFSGGDVGIAISAANTSALFNAKSNMAKQLTEIKNNTVYQYVDPNTGVVSFGDSSFPKGVDFGESPDEKDVRIARELADQQALEQYIKAKLACEWSGFTESGCNITEYNFSEEAREEIYAGYGEGSPGQQQMLSIIQTMKETGQTVEDVGEIACESVGTVCGVGLVGYKIVDGQDIGAIELVAIITPGVSVGASKALIKRLDDIPVSGAAKRTGTVFDSIKATQGTIKGTSIPKSFELASEGGKFWVHPNATKHMAEYLTRNGLSHSGSTGSQAMLTSFRQAVNQATAQGFKNEEMVYVGRWELIFSAGRSGDALPVIKHAIYK